MMAGRRRAVLFAGADYRGDEFERMPFAVERVERLRVALERFGYVCRVLVDRTAIEIDKTVDEVIKMSEPDDVVIVHVLTHSTVHPSGYLSVVGSDGRSTGSDVQRWTRNAHVAERAYVLFLLDICSAGQIIDQDIQRGRDRRVWVIGAAASQGVAFDGYFTSAVAEVVNSLADAELDIDAMLPNVPLPVFARAIRQRLNRLVESSDSYPQDVVATAVDLTAEVDAPFFPNPAYRRAGQLQNDLAEPERRTPFSSERVWSVAVLKLFGETVFALGTTNEVVLCDKYGVSTKQWVSPAVLAVAAIPAMNALLCGGRDGCVEIRSLPGLSTQVRLHDQGAQVNDVVVHGGLGASASDDGTVQVWNLNAHSLARELKPEAGLANTVVIIGDRPLIACGTSEGRLVMWDLGTGEELWRTPAASPMHDLVFGVVDDRSVLLCVHDDGTLVMWDIETRQVVRESKVDGGALRAVALAGDNITAVVGGRRGRISVIDLRDGVVQQSIEGEAGEIWSLAVYESDRGPAVVAGTDQGVRTFPLTAAVGSPATPVVRQFAGFSADVPTGTDRLGITAEVNTLCDLLLAKEVTPPLSVGLFGDWGTGKSFFMGQMRNRIGRLAGESQLAGLEGNESALCANVCQVEFNAWHYIDVDLWASLAATIFDQLAVADAATVSRAALQDLPSVQRLRDDLLERRRQTGELLTDADKKLAEESPIGVRDVLTTESVRTVADEAATRVDEALVAAGVPEDKVAEVDLREMADTTGALTRNLLFVLRRTRWTVRLLTLVAVLLVVVGPPVLSAWLGDRFGGVPTAISSYVLLGFAALVIGKPYLDRAARAIQAAKDLVTSIDDRRRAPVEVRRDTLRQRVADIDQQILSLDTRIRELRCGNSISAFAVERQEADHYRRHEGMVATLRRDLEEMSRRLTATMGQSADLERIILYIDDLDRCPPDRVVQVLQAIHLLLAFPLFVVVVGVDSRWLLRSLDIYLQDPHRPALPDEDRHWASTPQNYLEKIFQISLCLRSMSAVGYADLVSATVGVLEADPEQPPAAAPPVREPAETVPEHRPVDRTVPHRSSDHPADPPPVRGRAVRSYRDIDGVVHLSFSATGPFLESLDSTGVLTRRDLRGTDPRQETVRLGDSQIRDRLSEHPASQTDADTDPAAARRPVEAHTAVTSLHDLVASADGNKVSVWDANSGRLYADVLADNEVSAMAFSPDGGRLATGDTDGHIHVYVIRETKSNVDLTASALRLTAEEQAMIVAVRPFVDTPRSAKRLINTYRLLRAALTGTEMASLRSGGHQPVLLLLAILLGKPEKGADLLQELLSDKALPATFTTLIRHLTPARPAERTGNRRVAGRRNTATPGTLESTVTQIIHSTEATNDTAHYRQWAGVVSRYSFRTLDL